MRTLPLPNILHEKDGIYVLDFQALTQELKDKIDEYLIKICMGNRKIELKHVKQKFIQRINNNDAHRIGMISEFLIHLLLNTEQFEPYFLFFNLEDTSFKKGFDGVYIKGDNPLQIENLWLLESKSTHTDTTHKSRINTAYTTLKSMLSGENTTKNEGRIITPWDNACYHASLSYICGSLSIRDELESLSNNFDSQRYTKIDEFQIILCGTVFTENDNAHKDINLIYTSITKVKDEPSKDCIPIAITCRLLDEIIEYIKDGST